MNACFFTINSSEEKEVFQKSLSTGENAGKFDFYEFVPTEIDHTAGGKTWFELACERKIKCDILAISGHFGGNFFGASKVELTLDELETKSCQNNCQELLSIPKEVFLFGCNTLAGKEEDNRSASEYLTALLEHDYSMEEASRIVEQRYGAIGTTFYDSMRRVFKGVPHIYGFHSTGPSGKNIEQLLKNYLQKVSNYFDHLEKIEVQRAMALMNDFTKWNQRNNDLAFSLRSTNFAQTSGLLVLPCQTDEGLLKSDPLYDVLSNICKLKSLAANSNSQEVIDHAIYLLSKDDFALYIPAISKLSENSGLNKQLRQAVSALPGLKKKVLDLLNDSKTGFGKLKLAKLALDFGIIGEKEFLEVEKKEILRYLVPPLTVNTKDAICSYEFRNIIQIKKQDLADEVFQDANGLYAIACLELDDPAIINLLLKNAKNHKNRQIRQISMLALQNATSNTNEIIDFLRKQMLNRSDYQTAVFAFLALAELHYQSKEMTQKIQELLKSDKTISILGFSVKASQMSLTSLQKINLGSYSVIKNIHQLIVNKKLIEDNEDIIFTIADAISQLDGSEIIAFLQDAAWPTPNIHQEIKNSMMQRFETYYGRENTLRNLPLPVLPYFLDYRKETGKNINVSVPAVALRSIDDEKKYVAILDSANLTKESIRSVLRSSTFPLTSYGTSILAWAVDKYQSDPPYYRDVFLLYLRNRKNITDQERKILSTLDQAKSNDDDDVVSELKRLHVI